MISIRAMAILFWTIKMRFWDFVAPRLGVSLKVFYQNMSITEAFRAKRIFDKILFGLSLLRCPLEDPFEPQSSKKLDFEGLPQCTNWRKPKSVHYMQYFGRVCLFSHTICSTLEDLHFPIWQKSSKLVSPILTYLMSEVKFKFESKFRSNLK